MVLIISNGRLLDMVWFLFGLSISLFVCLIYRTHITSLISPKQPQKSVVIRGPTATKNERGISIIRNVSHSLVRPTYSGFIASKQRNNTEEEKKRKSVWKDVLKCQDIRLKRLKSRCKELYPRLDPNIINYREDQIYEFAHMIMHEKHKLLLKPILGTNESVWINVLLSGSNEYTEITNTKKGLNGVNINDVTRMEKLGLPILRRKFSLMKMVNFLKEYFSVITVKHPLIRIEQTYSDPYLRDADTALEFKRKNKKKKKGRGRKGRKRKRRRKHRRHLMADALDGGDKEGEELEDEIETGRSIKHPVTVKPGDHDNQFETFLDDLLSGKKHKNGYLAPYDDAFPCIVPFKFIAKEETLVNDLSYVMNIQLANGKDENIMDFMYQKFKEGFTNRVYLKYFSSLSHPKIYMTKVMQRYGYDMKLFGYSYHISNVTGKIYAECEQYDPEKRFCC